jgi:SAM-dependent methyltransferase
MHHSADPSAPPPERERIWSRERDFHDSLAREIDPTALHEPAVLGELDYALLRLAGSVRGHSVLDAGCGQGDLTMHLLHEGAHVTALDLSSGMVDVVRRRAERLDEPVRSRLRTTVAPLEESTLPADSFDLIVGRFILHHIDVESGGAELSRILRPGGRAIFVENWGLNPALSLARRWIAGRWGVPRLGTPDEHPLTPADLERFKRTFATVTAHYPVFEFLVLFDRQVLRFRYPRVSRVLRALDKATGRLVSPVRKYSYRVIVEFAGGFASERPPETL